LFLGVNVNAGAEERLFRGLALSSAAPSHRWQGVMKLLEPRRRLFYSQIVSARRGSGVLAIEDVAVHISKLPGGGGELKVLVAVTSATATSARPRDTIEGRRLRGKISLETRLT
jgi:D-lactate dehydrogenase (cytochrome)/glycolate oxidase